MKVFYFLFIIYLINLYSIKCEIIEKKESDKEVLMQLKNLMQKYVKLKHNNKAESSNFENVRFTEFEKEKQIKNNQSSKISNKRSDSLKKNNVEEKNPFTTSSINMEETDPEEAHQQGTRIRMFPYNIIINKPELIVKNPNRPIFVDQSILTKMLVNKPLGKSVITRSIPVSDCNKSWDYLIHGKDWVCMCQCGKSQSPINIIPGDINVRKMPNNIFFDFKNHEYCNSEPDNTCIFPIVKNSGLSIDIEDDCGILVMPPHNNGYRCYKIEIHSPSEHKINGKSFDLEIQIYFKLTDKRIVDKNTLDFAILSFFVKGIEDENLDQLQDGVLRDHPFLEFLELDKLPKKKGEARQLSKAIDYSLIFDKSKQPYKFKLKSAATRRKDNNSQIKFLETCTGNKRVLSKALNDLVYNRHYPLEEFYLYNGSFTKPPCDENVTYIVLSEPIYAPLDQILVLFIINFRNSQEL